MEIRSHHVLANFIRRSPGNYLAINPGVILRRNYRDGKARGYTIIGKREFVKLPASQFSQMLRELETRFVVNNAGGVPLSAWKPNQPLTQGPGVFEELRDRLKGQELSDIAHAMEPLEEISSYIPLPDDEWGGLDKVTQVLLEEVREYSTKIRKEDEFDDLEGPYRRYVTVVKQFRSSPSQAAKSSEYIANQESETALLDGRYGPGTKVPTVAPPIELFHVVFAHFRARLSNHQLAIPDETLREVASLLRHVSYIQTSDTDRPYNTRRQLTAILKIGIGPLEKLVKTNADHTISVTLPKIHEDAALAVIEEKSELGSAGSDPSVQGSFSYLRFWVQRTCQVVRESSCCPSFILGLAGPWLVILGGVLSGGVTVQRLTDYIWLGNSRVNDYDQVMRISRTLHALSLSIKELHDYYDKLEPNPFPSTIPLPHHPRFFPHITTYSSGDEMVNLTYLRSLEQESTCVTFLAEISGDDALDAKSKVVVKFVPDYGQEAHQLLADEDLAPKLLHYSNLSTPEADYGRLKMVVMEYIEGRTLAEVNPAGRISEDMMEQLKACLEHLHTAGLVFGDLRPPNVMVVDPWAKHPRIKLIDFDWAGSAGKVRFPFHLSRAVRGVGIVGNREVRDYDWITKEHDLAMLGNL